MNERRVRSKLLVYYLQLAEQGDQQATIKAKQLSQEIFFQGENRNEQILIEVSYASGEKKLYPSMKHLSDAIQLSEERLNEYLATNQVDSLGRRYAFYLKNE